MYLLNLRCDTDKDGVVSVKEVSQVCRIIGFNPPEAELQVCHEKIKHTQTHTLPLFDLWLFEHLSSFLLKDTLYYLL